MRTILLEDELAFIKTMPPYTQMAHVAMASLLRLPEDVLRLEICGPISSGGKGSIEANLSEFHDVITAFDDLGYAVFDQMPYEHIIQEMKAKDTETIGIDNAKIKLLEEFYRPIFASKAINTFVFMPDWHSSHGARWENERGKEYSIPRLELRELWKTLIKGGFKDIQHLTRPMY